MPFCDLDQRIRLWSELRNLTRRSLRPPEQIPCERRVRFAHGVAHPDQRKYSIRRLGNCGQGLAANCLVSLSRSDRCNGSECGRALSFVFDRFSNFQCTFPSFKSCKLGRDRTYQSKFRFAVAGFKFMLRSEDGICLLQGLNRFLFFLAFPMIASKSEHDRRDLGFITNAVERTVGKFDAAGRKKAEGYLCKQLIAMNVVNAFRFDARFFKGFHRAAAVSCFMK